MSQLLLLSLVAVVVAAVVFGVAVLLTGGDAGLGPVEPDGRSVPLPTDRPLGESDVAAVRFDTAARGYRMDQVDQALRRAAYDIGYKDELIGVLEAEVAALRAGRVAEADALRRTRQAAVASADAGAPPERPAPVEEPQDTPVDEPAGPTERLPVGVEGTEPGGRA
jgi:DivIVA domain-containing protein